MRQLLSRITFQGLVAATLALTLYNLGWVDSRVQAQNAGQCSDINTLGNIGNPNDDTTKNCPVAPNTLCSTTCVTCANTANRGTKLTSQIQYAAVCDATAGHCKTCPAGKWLIVCAGDLWTTNQCLMAMAGRCQLRLGNNTCTN